MRIGLANKATLPASSASAHAYKTTTYSLTVEGDKWVKLLKEDRRRGYDVLCKTLLRCHPQFVGFLKTIGAFAATAGRGFMIPLMRWGELPKPRDRDRYISELGLRISRIVSTHEAGWQAAYQDIQTSITRYVEEIEVRAKSRQRPDPFLRNQDFVNACEQAAVKLAFTKARAPLDYISMEILRRWTRTLGLANFSYHAPGGYALRFWPTAHVAQLENGLQINRRVGGLWRERIVDRLHAAYGRVRRLDRGGSPWVPIYRVRAAVCSELQVSDSEFDIGTARVPQE